MTNKYIPLHVHSEYSLLDGLSQTHDITSRLEEIEVGSCALTDHGTLSGAVDFQKQMSSTSFKPILGCEMYLCKQESSVKNPDNRKLKHQVILAKNIQGWKSHDSMLENFKDFLLPQMGT